MRFDLAATLQEVVADPSKEEAREFDPNSTESEGLAHLSGTT
jgi:hypothetical protein